VSASPSTLLADWERVRQSLAVISVSHEELDRFFSNTFDQLEALSSELLERQRTFLAEREESERELARQAARLEAQQAALSIQIEQQVHQERQAGVPAAAISLEYTEKLQQVLAETTQQREALHGAQAVAEAQANRLAELTEKLLDAQKGLLQAQEEIQRQAEELRAEAAAPPAADSSQDELRRQVQQLEKERAELHEERTVLEAELDSVRSRAAELAENLAQQQRQMAEDRAQWTEELKYLRRLVERLAQQNTDRETIPAVAHTTVENRSPAGRPESVAAGVNGDPVLDSVVAQFAMLQKDLAQRRKAGAHA